MLRSWRTFAAMGMFGLWPLIGCHQVPGDKSVQDLKPIQQKVGAGPRQELTAADIVQTALAKAEALEKAGKNDDAIAAYEKLREPGGQQGLVAGKKIALLCERNQDLDRAEQEYRRLTQQAPNDPFVLTKLGDLASWKARWGIAEKHYSDALRQQADLATARTGLANALAQQEQYDRSLAEYSKVLPKAEAYCSIAFVMKLQGKRQEAIKAYETALTLDPTLQRAQTELTQMKRAMLPDPPAAKVTLTTPYKVGQQATVELEDAPIRMISSERQTPDRIVLPPLPLADVPIAESKR